MLFSFKLLLCCIFFGGRKAKGKKGKFNFRIHKFLFHDYGWMFYGSESVSVCAGVRVSQSVLGKNHLREGTCAHLSYSAPFRSDKVKLKWVSDKKEVGRGLNWGGIWGFFENFWEILKNYLKKIQRNLSISWIQSCMELINSFFCFIRSIDFGRNLNSFPLHFIKPLKSYD